MEFNPGGIPEELKTLPQWVLWKPEQRDGRLTKMPYTVQGYKASVTDHKNWASFDVA
jgi:putative DNA primase/helicase